MDHVERFIVRRNNLKVSDQLEEKRQRSAKARVPEPGGSELCDEFIYPAHGELQLQLRQPPADAHPLPDAEGDVGERVDGAVLSQPALRLELLAVVEVVLAGAQGVAVDHQHGLQEPWQHVTLILTSTLLGQGCL